MPKDTKKRRNRGGISALLVLCTCFVYLIFQSEDFNLLKELEPASTEQQYTNINKSENNRKIGIDKNAAQTFSSISEGNIPEYDGFPYAIINNNNPDILKDEYTTTAFTKLSELDSLGRCKTAFGCFGQETIADGKRGSIGHIRPSGWQTVKYNDIIDGNYLYNRSHLLMWKLSGILDDNRNLITGTRYMNVEGMLPFEEMLVDYVETTGNHVMYRVTPIFQNDEPVARGVQMEAVSVEDEGKGVSFHIYCYNVQPGVTIDYATGDSWRSQEEQNKKRKSLQSDETTVTYILNTNTRKIHLLSCASVNQMKPKNKKETSESKENLIETGYSPCNECLGKK